MARAELLQYNIAYDQRENDTQFIAKQLETHLRERFNVLISTAQYDIVNEHLTRQGTVGPFINSIKKGRDIIQSLKPIEIDFARENAEVVGFEKIDSFLCNPATPIGSKMLSISPEGDPGSKYTHNFYDIFTLKEAQGKRLVELTRYSSGLSKDDYVKRLRLSYKDPKAEDFLINPITIEHSDLTAENIHGLLHINHNYVIPEEFEKKLLNSPYLEYYAKRYQSNRTAASFKAYLNAADEIWYGRIDRNFFHEPSYAETVYLENKKVRQAGGQCPGKSGTGDEDSPFSVSEFSSLGEDKYGERTFECPECGKTNVRPKDELLKNCQHCGSSKVSC